MAEDFRNARYWARELMERAIRPGDCVIDATMGNGHDTKWLCELVGDTGMVYAFDVQREAIESTRNRLAQAGLERRASLLLHGHQHMADYVPRQADAVLFNLGWLPGVEHAVTTRAETTLAAVDAALTLMKPGALMTVCVYPGHEEGARERDALLVWASKLDPARYDVMLRQYLNQPNSPPLMLAVRKRP